MWGTIPTASDLQQDNISVNGLTNCFPLLGGLRRDDIPTIVFGRGWVVLGSGKPDTPPLTVILRVCSTGGGAKPLHKHSPSNVVGVRD